MQPPIPTSSHPIPPFHLSFLPFPDAVAKIVALGWELLYRWMRKRSRMMARMKGAWGQRLDIVPEEKRGEGIGVDWEARVEVWKG